MKFSVSEREFYFIGMKHTERFAEYPIKIPNAVQQFNEQYPVREGDISAIIYEPKKGSEHEVGLFYVGVLLDELKKNIPEDMFQLHLKGRYASVREQFDPTKMGLFYDSLDQWIVENDLQRKDVFTEFMIELYYPSNEGIGDLEIFMRIN